MRAAVISVGSELLRGDIVDTNAAFLTRGLSELGFQVARVQQIGDDLVALTAAVQDSLQLAEIIVCTGGLGPTEDDLTRDAVAAAVGEEMFFDEGLLQDLESRFASLQRRMPHNNRRQALRIKSAESLPNPNGTAPGWFVHRGDRIVATLPGPPREMQPMWTDSLAPRLTPLLPENRAVLSLMTFGIGESMLERQIEDIIHWHAAVTVATYAKSAGVEVHVTARAPSAADASALRQEAESRLRERLGEAVFGTGAETLASAVGTHLSNRQLTLGTMESCTGGELATMITDVDGSSEYFVGGFVAYTRSMKEQFGVDPSIIDQYGIISHETARAMAESARKTLKSDVGIGTTGVVGHEPVEGNSPGTCYVAVSAENIDEVREIHRPGERDIIKRYFSQCALDLLRRQLIHSGMVRA